MKGKKILLGITGSIAAYKAALLTRLLKQQGAEVQILMTEAAKAFITPLTLSTLSERPVLSEYTKGPTGEWNSHVHLGLWADAMLIAPASLNTIGKMASGICDNLLLATYFSARCPVMVAPAMDLDMYVHPALTQNIERLRSFGNHMVEAEDGFLASGLQGKGRMAEPEHLLQALRQLLEQPLPRLQGKRVLLTAGPTCEYLDPVRFLTNASSGKMGYALAEAFAREGAQVTLVSGPVSLAPPQGVEVVPVTTAQEMLEATAERFEQAHIAVFSAAVADYTPKQVAPEKMKKGGKEMQLELVKTTDIAAEMGKRKRPGQITIGFALETEQEETHAAEKLRKKHFDFVVLNSLRHAGAGFGHDTNQIAILEPSQITRFPLKSKQEVARDIVEHLLQRLKP